VVPLDDGDTVLKTVGRTVPISDGLRVGISVLTCEGLFDIAEEGVKVGERVELEVGNAEGSAEGDLDGSKVVPNIVWLCEGDTVGAIVSGPDGVTVGLVGELGLLVCGTAGNIVGTCVRVAVGRPKDGLGVGLPDGPLD
jgi:hypothetical protein